MTLANDFIKSLWTHAVGQWRIGGWTNRLVFLKKRSTHRSASLLRSFVQDYSGRNCRVQRFNCYRVRNSQDRIAMRKLFRAEALAFITYQDSRGFAPVPF